MDLAAHQLAERGVDQPVPGQRQLALERIGDDQRLEVHAVVAAHRDARAGQALFDELLDGIGVQRDNPREACMSRSPAAAGPNGLLRREAHKMGRLRSEEHTSELQSLMRISYAVFCLKNKKTSTPSINAQ